MRRAHIPAPSAASSRAPARRSRTLVLAGVGFKVGHDAIHGSFSARPWVNRLFGATFDIIGANSANWSHAHNVVHHSFTNVPGVDKDLEPGPWLRFHPKAARHSL